MRLGEKLRYLRLVEGTLRGLGREMTQQDLARALKRELGGGLSQSYLSADRKRRPAASDQRVADGTGALLQSASRLSGG